MANIRIDGKLTYLGTFDTDTEAARAYDQAIFKHNKPTTKLNFPPQTTNDEIEIKTEPNLIQLTLL